MAFAKDLLKVCPNTKENHLLADYTSFRIGGPADIAAFPETSDELQKTVGLCHNKSIPFKILGGGSNVIISDQGFRGVVIINKSAYWEIISESEHIKKEIQEADNPAARLESYGEEYYNTEGLNYNDPKLTNLNKINQNEANAFETWYRKWSKWKLHPSLSVKALCCDLFV